MKLYTSTPNADPTSERVQSYDFNAFKPVTARYIRVQAYKASSVPADFPNGAKNIWLFADEILVQ
jgi:hypothetical protein